MEEREKNVIGFAIIFIYTIILATVAIGCGIQMTKIEKGEKRLFMAEKRINLLSQQWEQAKNGLDLTSAYEIYSRLHTLEQVTGLREGEAENGQKPASH